MKRECFSSVNESRECKHFHLASALWLVDDSAAVSLRYVLTRDGDDEFLGIVQLVLLLFILLSSLSSHGLIHVHSWTSAHLKP